MKSLIFAAIFAVSNFAFAHNGGVAIISNANEGPYGGGGMFCNVGDAHTNATGWILDLWEAEAFKKMPITRTDEPVNKQLQNALLLYSKMTQMDQTEIVQTAWKLYQDVAVDHKNPPPNGLVIAPPTDVSAQFIPTPGSVCQMLGVAAYQDAMDILFVDYDLYAALLTTDKAGLFVHESVYKYLRDHYHVGDSIPARNLTACIFADQPCPEVSPDYGIPTDGPLYRCHAEGWMEAAVNELDFDAEDYRMAEPWFYIFPIENSPGMTLSPGFTPWRLQQTMIKKRVPLSLDKFEFNEVPSRSFIDVQIDTPDMLKLNAQGHLSNMVLSPDGSLDMMLSTFASDDPTSWRRVLGPRFTYRLMPSPVLKAGDQSYLQINNSPLTCEKVR